MKRSTVTLFCLPLASCLLLLALLALLALACTGPAGEDGADGKDGQDLTDDDADAGDDDSAGGGTDDDDAPACWEVWAECEYSLPPDSNHQDADECGYRTGESVDPDAALAWERCSAPLYVAYYTGLLACGVDGGCDSDWKAEYYGCVLDYWTGYAACSEDSSTYDLFIDCRGYSPESAVAACGNR